MRRQRQRSVPCKVRMWMADSRSKPLTNVWDAIASEMDRTPQVFLTCGCGAMTDVTVTSRAFRFACVGCGKPWDCHDVAAANVLSTRNHCKAEVGQLANALGAILGEFASGLGKRQDVERIVDRIAIAAGPGPAAQIMAGLMRPKKPAPNIRVNE